MLKCYLADRQWGRQVEMRYRLPGKRTGPFGINLFLYIERNFSPLMEENDHCACVCVLVHVRVLVLVSSVLWSSFSGLGSYCLGPVFIIWKFQCVTSVGLIDVCACTCVCTHMCASTRSDVRAWCILVFISQALNELTCRFSHLLMMSQLLSGNQADSYRSYDEIVM